MLLWQFSALFDCNFSMSCQFVDDDSVPDSNYNKAQDNGSTSEEEVGRERDVAVDLSEEVSSEEGKAESDCDEYIATATVSRQSTRKIWKQNYYCIDIAPTQLPEHYKVIEIQHFRGDGSLQWIHNDRSHLRRTTGIRVT